MIDAGVSIGRIGNEAVNCENDGGGSCSRKRKGVEEGVQSRRRELKLEIVIAIVVITIIIEKS